MNEFNNTTLDYFSRTKDSIDLVLATDYIDEINPTLDNVLVALPHSLKNENNKRAKQLSMTDRLPSNRRPPYPANNSPNVGVSLEMRSGKQTGRKNRSFHPSVYE